ncbi:hypothetical protein ACUHZR_19535, partial [Photobacterium damselae subsp. piscicida]|uniref:hypothetical protein n=1 Tax=Photobacterium damselae TaxID=38293 RepID=UPI004040B5A6
MGCIIFNSLLCCDLLISRASKTAFNFNGLISNSVRFWVVTPIDLLMVKFTFYKRSNNLIVHLFAFR